MHPVSGKAVSRNKSLDLLNMIVGLFHTCLVSYLCYIYLSSPARALQEFISIRNTMYLIYGMTALFTGVLIAFRPNEKTTQIVPVLIISLILTTFSYAIAGLIMDLANIVTPIGF